MDAITPNQARALDAIERQPVTQRELGRILGYHQTYASELVHALETAGLVKGEPRPQRKRGRNPIEWSRTNQPRPPTRAHLGNKPPVTPKKPRPQPAPTPTGLFTDAPRLTITADRHNVTPRDEAEDLARRFLQQQPTHHGRKAVTARMLADYTGMTYLDALGALYRVTERSGRGVLVFEPDGRCATFYLGPKYKPHGDFGARTRPKPTPTATA